MDNELKAALDALQGEHKTAVTGLMSKYDSLVTQHAALQTQVDAIDATRQGRHAGSGETKTIGAEVFENASFKNFAEMGGRGKIAVRVDDFHTKTAITSSTLGGYTTGVLMPDRQPGIEGIQYRRLFIRDLLRKRTTTAAYIDYVRVLSFTNAASPQVEASNKAESGMTFDSISERVKTLAHWIPASKQALSDLASLQDSIDSHLMYGLKLKEELEILAGDNTGEHLHGIIPQATAFDTSLLAAGPGWNRLDLIARAIQQAERSDYTVDGIVLHTDDFWNMALTKDSQERYLFGEPSAMTVPRLWGRNVSVTNSITSGSFLLGAFQTAATLFDRMDAVIEASEEHADFFVKNMVAIRCEERLVLAVQRPAAFIYGTFSTSPVS